MEVFSYQTIFVLFQVMANLTSSKHIRFSATTNLKQGIDCSVLSKPYLWSPLNVYIYGLYLGFIVWERSPEWPKATSFLGWSGGIPPRSFFEINMCRDAIWCIFERQFWEMLRCVHWPRQVWMIFPICLLVYCNDTIFFWGGGEVSTPQIP